MSTNNISRTASAIVQSLFALRLGDSAPGNCGLVTYHNSNEPGPFAYEVARLISENDISTAGKRAVAMSVMDEVVTLVNAVMGPEQLDNVSDLNLEAIRIRRELETAVCNMLPGMISAPLYRVAHRRLSTFFTEYQVKFGHRIDSYFFNANDMPPHGDFEFIIRAQLVDAPSVDLND